MVRLTIGIINFRLQYADEMLTDAVGNPMILTPTTAT